MKPEDVHLAFDAWEYFVTDWVPDYLRQVAEENGVEDLWEPLGAWLCAQPEEATRYLRQPLDIRRETVDAFNKRLHDHLVPYALEAGEHNHDVERAVERAAFVGFLIGAIAQAKAMGGWEALGA